jgi:hypothetical protein
MSTESKEVLKNGKSNSPPLTTGKQQQVPNDLTPETSDDDFRKFIKRDEKAQLVTFISLPSADSRKSLNKPKNGKSEFEGNLRSLIDFK